MIHHNTIANKGHISKQFIFQTRNAMKRQSNIVNIQFFLPIAKVSDGKRSHFYSFSSLAVAKLKPDMFDIRTFRLMTSFLQLTTCLRKNYLIASASELILLHANNHHIPSPQIKKNIKFGANLTSIDTNSRIFTGKKAICEAAQFARTRTGEGT